MEKILTLLIFSSVLFSLGSTGFCPAGSTPLVLVNTNSYQPVKVLSSSTFLGSSTIREVALDSSTDPSLWQTWCYSRNEIWQGENFESFQNDETGLYLTAQFSPFAVNADVSVYDFTTTLTSPYIPFSIIRRYGQWRYAVTSIEGSSSFTMTLINFAAITASQKFVFLTPASVKLKANLINWGSGLPLGVSSSNGNQEVVIGQWSFWTVKAGVIKYVDGQGDLCLNVNEDQDSIKVVLNSDCSTAKFTIVPLENIPINGYVEFRYLSTNGNEYALQAESLGSIEYKVSLQPVLPEIDPGKPYQKWNVHYA